MSHGRSHERIGSRYLSRILLGALGILLVGGAWVTWHVATALPFERTTIVVDGDPVRVESWDDARGRLTVIPLPGDLYLDGAYGVGNLPIASIRRLEALDSKKNGVFVKSLAGALATPIVAVSSDLSLPLRFRLWWIMRQLRPDAITTLDLDSRGVFRSETLADGSGVRVFDINRFDAVIGAQLEVDSIRREGTRIRVVNTTDQAGLGNRAARFLSRAGMVVIAVESERAPQQACTAYAREDLWDRQSVRFIRDVFDCVASAQEGDERADVTVRLGSVYARRFTPDPH